MGPSATGNRKSGTLPKCGRLKHGKKKEKVIIGRKVNCELCQPSQNLSAWKTISRKKASKEGICSPCSRNSPLPTPCGECPCPSRCNTWTPRKSRADAPHRQVSAPRLGCLGARGRMCSLAQNLPPGLLSCISAPPSPQMTRKHTNPSRGPSTAIVPLVPKPMV